jgi:hypothetical protein
MRRRILSLLAVLVCPGLAFAQIPTVPRHIGQAMYTFTDRSPIKILTQHQTSGDWTKLQAYARELLKDFAKHAELKAMIGDVTTDYYNFVWESTNADGKAVVNRVLVQMQLKPQHASRLPGVSYKGPAALSEDALVQQAKAVPPVEAPIETVIPFDGPRVFDLLLSDNPVSSLSSVYVSTPAVNPAVAQLPDVVARVNVFGFAAKALGTGNSPTQIRVYVNQPVLPVSRAAIKIKDVIATRAAALDLLSDVETTQVNLRTRQARTSACARRLNDSLKAALDAAIKRPPPNNVCDSASDKCSALVKTTIAETYVSTVAACAPETLAPVGFDPVAAVEQEYKKLIATAGPKQTTGESTLTNTPLTRLSFGVMSGLLIGRTSLKEARVKMDGGKIANAPLERALTMVVLNIHPQAFDAEWNRMSREERLRVFFGTVLTPDFGFTAGAGLGIVRGLAFNAGAVFLLSETVKAGEKVGDPPKDTKDPFRSQLGIGGFIGFSYAFK